ncbi:P-loop containing nucleoside triphosphate hydrolase protein [Xylariales sp. PMI_506]|nr:P-loop containing nucleoside triphosphate hydrolase protein [Xylariales sp. PMI_506]
MDDWLKHYIPAGCLRTPSPDICAQSDALTWRFLSRNGDKIGGDGLFLDHASQEALGKSECLKPFAGLFDARWIQLAFQSDLIRVYIFPHDIDRRIMSRSNEGKLTKALSSLLKQLDYSPLTWSGTTDATPQSHPYGDLGPTQDEDCSLLDRFNQLPSPNPQLDAVTPNSFNALAMQGIMESRLPGLHTTLYPYQRRSAATMLQREVEPGRVVDPRLQKAVDQEKQPWYFDIDAGLVLKQPRYYDATSGGILAEEMGTGKTLICLSLILATKSLPSESPDPLVVEKPVRSQTGSLLDMAAATVNRHSYPWKLYLPSDQSETGVFYENCVGALESPKNRAFYELRNPLVETRTTGRVAPSAPPARKVFLSSTSLIIVPNNLVTQWQQEIKKHTSGLRVATIMENKEPIPSVTILLGYDVVIISQSRFEKIERERSNPTGRPIATHCPLEHIRFKRCIVDEGHKLGTRGTQWKSDLMKGLDNLEIAARWVVTGTPSRGLYGVDKKASHDRGMEDTEAINVQEREDLQRIGNITSKFLKVRPWCNTRDEVGDTPADWNVYVLQPKHHSRSSGRKDCLKATLESLIIRNRLSDVSEHLPPVDERIVFLDGSYQDKLSLNLFAMMIIFNSVQSQRTDQDYFFHPRQRKALTQLVSNLKQASFFGGVFFSTQEILKSIETAEIFLEKKDSTVSHEDYAMLKEAVEFGKLAAGNRLKDVSNQYHTMPIYLEHFPGGNGKNWSLDDKDNDNGPVCTDAGLVLALQKYISPCIDAPTSLNLMITTGQLAAHGDSMRSTALREAIQAGAGPTDAAAQSSSLAGHTSLGVDHHTIRKSSMLPETVSESLPEQAVKPSIDIEIAKPLEKTRIISTISAKLSYLVDSIVKYQEEEQIIVFYENDNVAWYLAAALEILQIQHLIYTRKGLDAKRRAQYVSTFTYNPKFRVLLMDISQAAYGLDMRSASRIYFVSPVLNPQVEAQAIGRARRLSQQKPVTVETLVLRGSIEEVIVERRKKMTAAEHRRVKSILDDRPMYNWILNAQIMPLLKVEDDVSQTAMLEVPQYVFGREFGREVHPDEGLITESPVSKEKERAVDTESTAKIPGRVPFRLGGIKRPQISSSAPKTDDRMDEAPPAKKPRIVWADDV